MTVVWAPHSGKGDGAAFPSLQNARTTLTEAELPTQGPSHTRVPDGGCAMAPASVPAPSCMSLLLHGPSLAQGTACALHMLLHPMTRVPSPSQTVTGCSCGRY